MPNPIQPQYQLTPVWCPPEIFWKTNEKVDTVVNQQNSLPNYSARVTGK